MPEPDPRRGQAVRLLRPAANDLIAEARELAGSAPTTVEPLMHGHRYSTGGVWRVRWGRESAVVKVLSGAGAPPDRPASHFRWWRREALILQHGLPPAYAAAGIRPPRLLRLVERPDKNVALWQEDSAGASGFQWSLSQYLAAARRLGHAQAALPLPAEDWWSSRFLADYLAEWDAQLDRSLLQSDAAWAAPLIRECWSPHFRERLRRFLELRPRLLALRAHLPQVLCHLDFWPPNLFDAGAELVVVDWAFAGRGVLGEDIANLLPDCAFDLIQPASAVRAMAEPVLAAYFEGWQGDPRLVRLGLLASSVKYAWLPIAMLAQAGHTEHAAYGGNLPVDSKRLYRERGLALEMLFDWADEAERLAAELAIR